MESYLCLHGYERLSHAVACSSTWAGTQRVLQLEVLPISCLHQKKNELSLCHPPRKNLLGVCRLLLHQGWGSAGPPARSIADILPPSEEKMTILMPPTTEKFTSSMPPASPPGLGLSGSSSLKYCRYLACSRKKMNYRYATHHRIIY
jgi:hypothetical protein